MTRSNTAPSGADTPQREQLATTAEVAEYLHITADGLAQLRYRREGPPYVKIGARVLYRWSDVHKWVSARVRNA